LKLGSESYQLDACFTAIEGDISLAVAYSGYSGFVGCSSEIPPRSVAVFSVCLGGSSGNTDSCFGSNYAIEPSRSLTIALLVAWLPKMRDGEIPQVFMYHRVWIYPG